MTDVFRKIQLQHRPQFRRSDDSEDGMGDAQNFVDGNRSYCRQSPGDSRIDHYLCWPLMTVKTFPNQVMRRV